MQKQSLIYNFLNISSKLKRQIKADIGSNNTNIPFALLASLGTEGKSLKELSLLMNCTKQEVSRQVKRAIENDWVNIQDDLKDKRSKTVSVSTAGKSLLKNGFSYYQKKENAWQSALGQEDFEKLIQLLSKLDKHIQQDD